VNSWLYPLVVTSWRPGAASSVRMSRANRPATKKKAKELSRYRMPMRLWSVVVSHWISQCRCGSGASSGALGSEIAS
jgi:hypothetical protein